MVSSDSLFSSSPNISFNTILKWIYNEKFENLPIKLIVLSPKFRQEKKIRNKK